MFQVLHYNVSKITAPMVRPPGPRLVYAERQRHRDDNRSQAGYPPGAGLYGDAGYGSLYPVSVGIKWPNDVVVNGKKICGILTEMSAEMTGIHYLVIGTGINTNVEEFPEEIQSVATSLIKELGEKVNRAELIAACLKYFEEYYEKYIAAGNLAPLKEDYEALLLNRNNKVRVLEPNHEYTGLSLGINEDGELLVEKEDGTVTAVYAGEVSVRGVYGYV